MCYVGNIIWGCALRHLMSGVSFSNEGLMDVMSGVSLQDMLSIFILMSGVSVYNACLTYVMSGVSC